MLLQPDRIELSGEANATAAFTSGTVGLGPLEVTIGDAGSSGPAALSWSVANRGDRPVSVRSVALVFRLGEPEQPLRMFRNGYQSWTPSGVAAFGVDRDPSTAPGSIRLARGVHHADQEVARPGELRSEWVTVLQGGGGAPLLVGFDGGDRHDGTLRLRQVADGSDGEAELWVEAFLGGAVIAAGEERDLHAVLVADASVDGADASTLLEHWADEVGRIGRARVTAPFQVGWCSWYHYFHRVSEADLRHNLALAGDWPFDVFQLDDGFQSAIGDWLTTNERFPSDLDAIAGSIAATGARPGLWIAPFIASPDSQVIADHPDWVARNRKGDPLIGTYNPPWGGGLGGRMYALDTSRPEVLAHLESVAAALVDAGFTYLKLDFTFAPSFDGVFQDTGLTPAQRVRAGFDAVRRGAGDDAFILGCGVPLANVVGVVDGNRIGADVAPSWETVNFETAAPGYERALPATVHSWQNTLARSFMHRKLWLNDPDCVMLRESETEMTPAAVRTWAHAVGMSGGMALVSDDLALLDESARTLLDEIVTLGRLSDDEAVAGSPARCTDLLRHAVPRELRAARRTLEGDPAQATSVLRRDPST